MINKIVKIKFLTKIYKQIVLICQRINLISIKQNIITLKTYLQKRTHLLATTFSIPKGKLLVLPINQFRSWTKWVTQKLFILAIHATTITIPLSKLKKKQLSKNFFKKLVELVLKVKKMLFGIKSKIHIDT